MSYILEALKKAEQERQLGQVPRLTQTTPMPLFQGAAETLPLQRAAGWLLGSLLIIAVTAASLGHWFAQTMQPQPPAAPLATPTAQVDNNSVAPVSTAKAFIAPVPATPQVLPESKQQQESVPSTQPPPTVSPLAQQQQRTVTPPKVETTLSESRPAPQAKPVTKPPPEPETPPPLPRVVKPSAVILPPTTIPSIPEQTLILLQELPAEIQQTILPLKINVHVYAADSTQRFVLINGQRYREGMQLIDKPIKLLQIRPNDIILRYQEWHIRLNPL